MWHFVLFYQSLEAINMIDSPKSVEIEETRVGSLLGKLGLNMASLRMRIGLKALLCIVAINHPACSEADNTESIIDLTAKDVWVDAGNDSEDLVEVYAEDIGNVYATDSEDSSDVVNLPDPATCPTFEGVSEKGPCIFDAEEVDENTVNDTVFIANLIITQLSTIFADTTPKIIINGDKLIAYKNANKEALNITIVDIDNESRRISIDIVNDGKTTHKLAWMMVDNWKKLSILWINRKDLCDREIGRTLDVDEAGGDVFTIEWRGFSPGNCTPGTTEIICPENGTTQSVVCIESNDGSKKFPSTYTGQLHEDTVNNVERAEVVLKQLRKILEKNFGIVI